VRLPHVGSVGPTGTPASSSEGADDTEDNGAPGAGALDAIVAGEDARGAEPPQAASKSEVRRAHARRPWRRGRGLQRLREVMGSRPEP
jgi:hypothetical protein